MIHIKNSKQACFAYSLYIRSTSFSFPFWMTNVTLDHKTSLK